MFIAIIIIYQRKSSSSAIKNFQPFKNCDYRFWEPDILYFLIKNTGSKLNLGCHFFLFCGCRTPVLCSLGVFMYIMLSQSWDLFLRKSKEIREKYIATVYKKKKKGGTKHQKEKKNNIDTKSLLLCDRVSISDQTEVYSLEYF